MYFNLSFRGIRGVLGTVCPLHANEEPFGPVSACRPYDFTQLFEESIFGIGLTVIFFFIAVLRLIQLRCKPCRSHCASNTDLVLWVVLTIAALAILIAWSLNAGRTTVATIPDAVLQFLLIILLGLTTVQERSKSDRPPLVTTAYFTLSLLFDLARVRTYWLSPRIHIVAALYSAYFALKLCTVAYLNVRRHPHDRVRDEKNIAPEQSAGIYGMGLWLWLNHFLVYGYRRGITSLSDLDSIAPDLLSPKQDGGVLPRGWKSVPGKYALLRAVATSLRTSMLAPIMPRLAQTFFTFMQPLLLARSIKYAETDVPDPNAGYALIGAYALVYIGYAIASAQYWHYVNRAVTKIRAVLVTEVFHKTESLPADAVSNTDAITLMSTDVERICKGIKSVHEIWATAIDTGIALYLLQREVGVIAIVPVGIALTCACASSWTAGVAGTRQKVWLESLQKRLQYTLPAVSAIRELRMLGLTEHVRGMIDRLRRIEVGSARLFRHIIVISVVLAYATVTISPAIVFGLLAYRSSSQNRAFDASRVFTSLSLINLLATPLITFLQFLPQIASAVANFTRIQLFLQAEPHCDRRSGHGQCPRSGRVESLDAIELQVKPSTSTSTLKINIVEIMGACFDFCLPHVDLTFPRGSFTAVIGPSGSGKSSLLRAILGENSPTAGTVRVETRKIAFSDQTPWIMNRTIRENIIGLVDTDSPIAINEAFYAEVFRACELETDFPNSSLGRLCVAGSKGANLSGGQRQRVSLARSVYARAALSLLDDVFSGLDPVTEAKIAEALFGAQGLLRRGDQTTVLASHSTHSLRWADQIVVLSPTGYIEQVGTLDQLLTSNEFVRTAYQNRNRRAKGKARDNGAALSPPAYEEVASTPALKLPELQDTRSMRVYWHYFQAFGTINLVLFFVLGLAFTFTLRFPDVWLSWWASDGTSANPTRTTSVYLGVYVGLQIATLLLIALWAWLYFCRAVASSGIALHGRLLVAVLFAKMQFLIPFDHGVIANYFSQDLQLVDSELPNALINAVAEILSGIAQLGLIAMFSIYICAVYPAIMATLYLIQRFYLKTSQPLRIMDIEAKAPLYTQFMETLNGLATIRAFGWHPQMRARNRELLDASQKPFYLMLSVQQWLNLVLNLVVAGLAIIIMGLVTPLRHIISPAYLGVALTNVMTLGETLRNLVLWWTQLQSSIGAVKRIEDFAATAPLEDDDKRYNDGVPYPATGALPIQSLSFSAVNASYPRASESSPRPALSGINFDIPAGSTVGICGRSGSGKSTLLSLLFRLLEVDSGIITLDGGNITAIPHGRLRASINAISQSPLLLPGSWRSNLDPTGRISDDVKLWEALACVRLDAVVRNMGGGSLDADAACGDSLSLGQRQLFCLARALLKKQDRGIVVLDEISSSVDATTDAFMREIVFREFAGQTILVVAHRLDWVMECQMAVVLDQGRVAEMGPPGTLVEAGGLFGALWRAEREAHERNE